MFGGTTISYIKIWNHPIETTIYKWLFGVPGRCWLINPLRTYFLAAGWCAWHWVVPLGLLVVDLSMVTHVNPTFGPYKDRPSMQIHRYQSNG